MMRENNMIAKGRGLKLRRALVLFSLLSLVLISLSASAEYKTLSNGYCNGGTREADGINVEDGLAGRRGDYRNARLYPPYDSYGWCITYCNQKCDGSVYGLWGQCGYMIPYDIPLGEHLSSGYKTCSVTIKTVDFTNDESLQYTDIHLFPPTSGNFLGSSPNYCENAPFCDGSPKDHCWDTTFNTDEIINTDVYVACDGDIKLDPAGESFNIYRVKLECDLDSYCEFDSDCCDEGDICENNQCQPGCTPGDIRFYDFLPKFIVDSEAVPAVGDFDNDGVDDRAAYKVDFDGANDWWINYSSNGDTIIANLGAPGFVPAPGDFDGDGQDDLAAFNGDWSGALDWYIKYSQSGAIGQANWGFDDPNLVPAPGDFDGDGIDDLTFYFKGPYSFEIKRSSDSSVATAVFGDNMNQVPVPSDFDGDGIDDLAIYDPTTNLWKLQYSSNTQTVSTTYGVNAEQMAAPGDFNGDGVSELTLYNPDTGYWVIDQNPCEELVQEVCQANYRWGNPQRLDNKDGLPCGRGNCGYCLNGMCIGQGMCNPGDQKACEVSGGTPDPVTCQADCQWESCDTTTTSTTTSSTTTIILCAGEEHRVVMTNFGTNDDEEETISSSFIATPFTGGVITKMYASGDLDAADEGFSLLIDEVVFADYMQTGVEDCSYRIPVDNYGAGVDYWGYDLTALIVDKTEFTLKAETNQNMHVGEGCSDTSLKLVMCLDLSEAAAGFEGINYTGTCYNTKDDDQDVIQDWDTQTWGFSATWPTTGEPTGHGSQPKGDDGCPVNITFITIDSGFAPV